MKTLAELKAEKQANDERERQKEREVWEANERYKKQYREKRIPELTGYVEMEILPKIMEALNRNQAEASIYMTENDEVTSQFVVELLRGAGYKVHLKREWSPEEYNSDYGCNVGGQFYCTLEMDLR